MTTADVLLQILALRARFDRERHDDPQQDDAVAAVLVDAEDCLLQTAVTAPPQSAAEALALARLVTWMLRDATGSTALTSWDSTIITAIGRVETFLAELVDRPH